MPNASPRAVTDRSRDTGSTKPEGSAGADPAALRVEGMRGDALWQTAPWRAGLSIVCLLVCAFAMAPRAPLGWLGAWTAGILALNLAALAAHRRAARYPVGAIGRSGLWLAGEAIVHAALWGMLPGALFAVLPAETQMLVAAALGTMIAGAFVMVLAPAAAAAWALILTGALMYGVHQAGGAAAPVLSLLLGAYLAVILTGCLAVERVVSGMMEATLRERTRADAAAELLHEHEERGVGWLWQTDAAGAFSYVSPRLGNLLGRGTAQLLGQPLTKVLGLDARLGGAIAAREPFEALQLRVATPRGERWVALSGDPIVHAGGGFGGYRGVGIDITDRHRAEERLATLATKDVLTGLPNRQDIGETMRDAIARSHQDGVPRAMFYLDLDGFKPVNDTFGHSAGDAVLRGVARRLADTVGESGWIGRIGGDEFALVLRDGASRAEAEALGERLIAAVSQPFPIASGEVRVGLSVGCAFALDDGATLEELAHKADLALYEAKAQGRGRYRAFEPEMQHAADRRLRTERELREAIVGGQLALRYQPIVDPRNDTIHGFEALVHWQHPSRGLIGPAEFLPAAEEAGLIGEIGAWAIGAAARDAATWPEPMFVSIDVSPRELELPRYAETVAAAFALARLPAERLMLELSERRLPGGAEAAFAVLRRLRKLGVRLALDDFGGGRAALDHVTSGVFDTLKIEGARVSGASQDARRLAIFRAIVAAARALGVNVVAQGVEAPGDLASAVSLRCDEAQGALLGHPMPYAEAMELLGMRRLPSAMPGGIERAMRFTA